MKKNTLLPSKTLVLCAGFVLVEFEAYARAGGSGGSSSRSSSRSSSSSSSRSSSSRSSSDDDNHSSFSSSNHNYSSSGSSGNGDANTNYAGSTSDTSSSAPVERKLSPAERETQITLYLFFSIFIAMFITAIFQARKKAKKRRKVVSWKPTLSPAPPTPGWIQFPDGLNDQKVSIAFMEIQKAWQNQDLSKVRRWMSDGVYQRFTVQFEMMRKLTQRNYIEQIDVKKVFVKNVGSDGNYEITDIGITFQLNDHFICIDYPHLNQIFLGDSATEYWTFIRRKDANADGDLYLKSKCPNCGAALDNSLGELSRCASCHTLINNAFYDWILSEITQENDYTGTNVLSKNDTLLELAKNDPLFSIQRMEDIASNVFMQIMEVFTGDNNKKLSRFASKAIAESILKQKEEMGNFVFDRLYLNDVTLKSCDTDTGKLNLAFALSASYQRVRTEKPLVLLDNEIAVHHFEMVLSRDVITSQHPTKEVVFSYECANCGAPYDDTTNDVCNYCNTTVIDTSRNWVLTYFRWGE